MIDQETDRDTQVLLEYVANEKALEKEFINFRLWYRLFYLHRDKSTFDRENFSKEVERRLRRIHDLSIKSEMHYYSLMMETTSPEDL